MTEESKQTRRTDNALNYLRVSTKEQAEGYSIAAQREANTSYIAAQGWNVVDEFVDAGESARTADRPNLRAMLERVAEGDIDVIVVHKIDRLARNLEDHVAIRAALRKSGVRFASVTENIEESASGRLVEGIHALMAEFYSANLAAEVKKGLSQKAKQGGWPSRAPVGYRNVRESGEYGRGVAKVVLDPKRAMLMKEAFRLYATGDYSIAELASAMAGKGLTNPYSKRPGATMGVATLAQVLANPFYIGVVDWNGVQYKGQHKALVSKNVFERVQEVLRLHNKAGVRERTHDHYLKGLLYCGECGSRLSLTLAKGKYSYFYCLGQKNARRHQTGCTQKYVMADEAEKMVEQLYKRVQLPEEWTLRLNTELEEEIVERQAIASELRVHLTRRLSELAEERQKLLKAYYLNAIPVELLKTEQDRITKSEESAKAELQSTEADLAGWEEVLKLAIRLAGSCYDAYMKAHPKVRRRFNEAVLKAVNIADGKTKPQFTELFDRLFSGNGSNKGLLVELRRFELLTSTMPS